MYYQLYSLGLNYLFTIKGVFELRNSHDHSLSIISSLSKSPQWLRMHMFKIASWQGLKTKKPTGNLKLWTPVSKDRVNRDNQDLRMYVEVKKIFFFKFKWSKDLQFCLFHYRLTKFSTKHTYGFSKQRRVKAEELFF